MKPGSRPPGCCCVQAAGCGGRGRCTPGLAGTQDVELIHSINHTRPSPELAMSRLRDVVGGDDARLAMLAGPLATKLVGRESSRPALELLASVLSARGVAVPNLPQAVVAESVELAATVSTPQAEEARGFGQPVHNAVASEVMGSAGLGGLGGHHELAVRFAQGEQPRYDAGWFDPSSGGSGLPPGLS